MVVSKRRSREGPAVKDEEQEFDAARAPKLNLARGAFRVNAHEKDKSAVEYRESNQKPPTFLLNRFQEMMRTHRQAVPQEQLAFLDTYEEREGIRHLAERSDSLRAERDDGAEKELAALECRRQMLRQSLTEKETQQRRLRLALQKAQEESRRRAGKADWTAWSLVSGGEEQIPPEDGKPPASPNGEDKSKPVDGDGSLSQDSVQNDPAEKPSQKNPKKTENP